MRIVTLSILSSVVFGIACAIGCSSAATGSGFNDGNGNGNGNGNGSGGGADGGQFGGDANFGGGGGDSGANQNGCSDAAKLVYVLSSDNDLYSFQPQQKKFTKIGRLACQTSMTPNSMAIDRDAVAWVNYAEADQLTGTDTAGAIFKVKTTDASCQSTSISLSKGWYRLGMGFATDSANGTSETLYVAGSPSGGLGGGNNSPGLAQIDLGAQKLVPVGAFTGSLKGQNAELTGTGDARLYGFFTTTPVQVAEINKTSGAIVGANPLNGVETPSFWAFSFWGGEFYLYTAPDAQTNPQRTSNVTHYVPGGATDTAYMTNVGFRIVGAGVSTCAPITPPR
jgi:hypothetical protein